MNRKALNICVSAFYILASALWSEAAVPAGYYDKCEGKSGKELLQALYSTISDHTNVGYDGLWNVYKKSDVRPDGTLWDIYTTKAWQSNFTKCGNYSVVGDCVNREHSLPQSWWGGGKATQYSDAFHLYPTDGKVNGQRSNFPYGECANGTRLPSNGSVQALGKLGNCTFSGYSGTVFEPDDQYKGDLARSYFYMAACYNGIVSNWRSGNGDKVFAGNNYPVFTDWTLRLLLKWSRQDAVSEKETNRNEAIYTFQRNRNPFIDHPEMVEHIWGDKKTQPWYSNATSQPEILLPVKDYAVNLGQAAVGVPRSVKVQVKCANLTEALSLRTTGNYSVTPTTLTAAAACAGTEVTVTLLATSPGDAEGRLDISSSEVSRSVDLTATVLSGLPAEVTDVTSGGFIVRWVNLHGTTGTDYKVHVLQGNAAVPGFPMSVPSTAEELKVEGLDPLTDYVVRVEAPAVTSKDVNVTTADLMPYIQLLFDGTLHFDAEPDVVSEAAELLLNVENVAEPIVIKVNKPFEVSTDKSSWGESVNLDPEEERFYLRIAASPAGNYTTEITITAGSYTADDYEATATVAAPVNFVETWEFPEADNNGSYSAKEVKAVACRWAISNGGFWPGQDKTYNKSTVLRLGKENNSSVAMAEDKERGLGTVTFEAVKYGTDEAPKVTLEYSTDGGNSWTHAADFTIENTSKNPMTKYRAVINATGNGRIRLRQTSGKRWILDNIGITDHTSLAAVDALDYHTWDAWSRDGKLVIEVREKPRTIAVYGMDGITRFNSEVGCDTVSVNVPKGLYIVVSDDFSRRVLVK